MDDIAEHLGLSKYSVSRALAGKPGVSEATRQRVWKAAKELGYEFLGEERARRHLGHQIVLIIRRDEAHDYEFWMDVISGCEEAARKAGYSLVTRPLTEAEMNREPALDAVAGLIVAGSRARPAMKHYTAKGIPTVLITYPNPLEKIDAVTIADREGGYAVGEHLTGLGHRRLAFAADFPDKPSHANRYYGFVEAVRRVEGADVTRIVLDPDAPGASFERSFVRLQERGQQPTAVFCATDGLALTVMWALNRNGLRVPEDVSVVGCNGIIEAQRSVPKLTTLHIPKRAIGAEAVRLLMAAIEGERPDDVPRRISLPPSLVVRESTAPPPSVEQPSGGHAAAAQTR